MRGLKVGHFSNQEAGTGVSVFLFEQGAVGTSLIGGAAPASHELSALEPENSVEKLHGLVLTGGSAYGLYAAQGVMTYLTERGIGYPTPHGVVPIVPAAGLYDLNYKQPVAPTAENAYQACLTATENNLASGRMGAGTGATVGKLIAQAKRMTSGLGVAEVKLASGIQVIAYAAVNAVGDVIDDAGQIIAGARFEKGEFANCEQYLLSGQAEIDLFNHTNTTLVGVFTNAKLTKDASKRIGKMALAGMARAISPAFTRYDGDTIFCISIGEETISELTLGTMAADAVKRAIRNAVKNSEVI